MTKQTYRYTKIRENIWQIADEDGVYMTLVQGKDLAVLLDTGYGREGLREFIEEQVKTPYIVVNSHGHPDHSLGDDQFDAIYARKEEWEVIHHYVTEQKEDYMLPMLRELMIGQIIDLGGLHAKVVDMRGHTKGSIGLLLLEERLLLSGDGINESLWVFNYGALPLSELRKMLVGLKKQPFDTFLGGHSEKEQDKSMIDVHLHNLDQLNVDVSTKQTIFGTETYTSTYEEGGMTSSIVFALELLV